MTIATVQCVNKAPFARHDVVTCTIPLAEGEVSSRSTELRALDTGYLGAGVAERVQWYPVGDDPIRGEQYPALHPDGSFRFLRVSFPVTLPAATGTTPALFGRRTVTLEVGSGTLRPFTFHADVLTTLSGLAAGVGLHVSGQSPEEVALDLWAAVQAGAIEGQSDANACRRRYRVWKRMRPRNDASPDVRHSLYAEVVFDIYSNMRHVEVWIAFGNSLIQRTLGGALYGTALGPYSAARIITLAGNVTLRIKSPDGDGSSAHWDLRSWGHDTFGRTTSASGTTYTLIKPGTGQNGDRIGQGQRLQYRGVIHCGTPNADDTERAERWCPSNAPTRGGDDVLACSVDWPGKNPPFFTVPEYPSYIPNREDGIRRIELDAAARIEDGGEANPYADNRYVLHWDPSVTGEQGGAAFGAHRGWSLMRAGWPGELPAIQRGTRREGLRPCWYYEEDGTPLNMSDPVLSSPDFVVWDNQPHSTSLERFGYAIAPLVGKGEGLGLWFSHDRQHWMSSYANVDALVSADWWALHAHQHLAHLWCAAMNSRSSNASVRNNDNNPRGEGRPARVGALLFELYSLPLLRQRIIDRIDQYDRTYTGRAALPRSAVGDLIMPFGVGPSGPTALPYNSSIAWQEAFVAMGLLGFARVLGRRTDDAAAVAAAATALRIAREVATTWMLYGWWGNPERTEQLLRTSNPPDIRDRALAGRRVTQASTGASGIIRFCIDLSGLRLYLSDCVGVFGPGPLTIEGDARVPQVAFNHGVFGGAPGFYYPNHQAPNNATGMGAFQPLDRARRFSLRPNPGAGPTYQLSGEFASWSHEYVGWGAAVAAVCRDALRSSTFYTQAVADRVRHFVDAFMAWIKPSTALTWDEDTTEHVAIIEDAFNASLVNAPPAAPTGLQVTAASTTELAVTWQHNGQNLDGFRLEHRPDGSTEWTLVPLGPTARGHLITELDPGSKHWVLVRAHNAHGQSPNTPEVSGTTQGLPPLLAPTGTAAVGTSSSSIRVTWTDTNHGVASETHTVIEESPDGVGSWAQVGFVPADQTWFDRGGLSSDTTRYYRPVPYRDAVAGPPGPVGVGTTLPAGGEPVPPDTPTGLAVASKFAATSTAGFLLTFAPAGTGTAATGFEVQVSPAGAGTWLTAWTGTAAPATIAGLQPGTEYDLEVAAVNAGGRSAWSATVTDTTATITPPEPPDPPTDLGAVALASRRVRLTWTAAAGLVAEQQIERRNLTSGDDWQPLATVAAGVELYDDTAVEPETEYEYQVRAVGIDGVPTDYSDSSAATTPADPGGGTQEPHQITGLQAAVVGSESATLQWNDTNSAPNEDGVQLQWQRLTGPLAAVDPGAWLPLADLPADSTSFGVVGLTPGTTYAARAVAHRQGLRGPWSATLRLTTSGGAVGTPPAAPSGLSVTPGTESADLEWTDEATDETAYHIDLALGSGPFVRWGTDLPADTEAATIDGLQPATTYRARVLCSRDGVASVATPAVEFATLPAVGGGSRPATPGVLIARAHRTRDQVHLTWQDRASNELGQRVWRWTAGQSEFEAIAELGPNVESYVDRAVRPGQLYLYQVEAWNAVGGSLSAVASTVTSVETPHGRVRLNIKTTFAVGGVVP